MAIEQFDAQPAGRVVFGFGEGWNEQEYNPATGVLWRWTSDRVGDPRAGRRAMPLALTLRGEIEAASTSARRRPGGRRASWRVRRRRRRFADSASIPADGRRQRRERRSRIETSAWYVPAETRGGRADRRRLGLKLFECRITPAS